MRNPISPLEVSRFLHRHEQAAFQKGIKVSIGFDFHEYVAITEATPTKGKTSPVFRPNRSPIKPDEGYWVVGFDNDNEVALVAAARLYNLHHSNLAEHLQSLRFFYADPTKHAHPQDSCICKAPSAGTITGKVAYHGDFWVRREFRGQGMAAVTTGILLGASLAMWAPDFTCALAGKWTVDKQVYDCPHCEPGGSILRLVAEGIQDDDWLFWRTGEEMIRQIDRHNRSA